LTADNFLRTVVVLMTKRPHYAVNSFGIPEVDAALEAAAGMAEPMTSAEAELHFDREWWRLYGLKTNAPGPDEAAARSALLIGLACMRSMARADKEANHRCSETRYWK
jgi:hypothetical protein